jgi:hypothetical protein
MPGFAKDIKPLFRESDREEMEFAFDLWSYQDVKENAMGILSRLEDRTMPCDTPWDDEYIGQFRTWTGSGCPP